MNARTDHAHDARRLWHYDICNYLGNQPSGISACQSFGRVASLNLMFSSALLPIGYLAVGAVADKLGDIFTIGMFASIGMCIVLGVLCIPHIRRFQ